MSIYKSLIAAILITAGLTSCQKMERPKLVIIPDDVAKLNGPLQRNLWFEDSGIDSIYYEKGVASNVAYEAGVQGKAYKGATNAMMVFGAGAKIGSMTSFTVAFWMNTQKHTGGAQSIFMLGRSSDFWGNMFALVEGNDNTADNSMLLKFNFAGNWVEFNNNNGLNRLPDMYGKWKHIAFRYDEKTSVFSLFVDGEKYAIPDAVANRMKDNKPLGALQFIDPSKFVIGAFQQHAGVSGNPDGWMLRYTGLLDQFKVFTVAITDAEIKALFTTKR